MKITALNNASKVSANLDGFIMHSSPALEVIHLLLHPGQSVPQHPNISDVVVCLIEGEVILDTEEKHLQLSLYDTVEIEKSTNRGFSNPGELNARLLIVKKQ